MEGNLFTFLVGIQWTPPIKMEVFLSALVLFLRVISLLLVLISQLCWKTNIWIWECSEEVIISQISWMNKNQAAFTEFYPETWKQKEPFLARIQKMEDYLDDHQMQRENRRNKDNDPNSRGKQAVKQAKDNLMGSENYVHVRAKRGQATNSHSLAERVRRERISERMKLLQDLVPGCSKITGKAVMLDEIINYVQSLQQQVEFLSMKLATANPELNMDLERILPSEILHPQGNEASIIGTGPGQSFPESFQGLPQVTMSGFTFTNPPFHHLPPTAWNSELQSIFRSGFGSNHANGPL